MKKNRPLQIFDSDRISADRELSKTEIARFVSDFQLIIHGDEGKRKLISLRVPERILSRFRSLAEGVGVPYQTQILNLMRQWVLSSDQTVKTQDRSTLRVRPGLGLNKVISGGQTGVDRAALDVCLMLKVPCGGWCPRNRKAEDGTIDQIYPLQEVVSEKYEQRTEWNVRDSDATLILTWGNPIGGTRLTQRLASDHQKPLFIIDFKKRIDPPLDSVLSWLEKHSAKTLNIAGPRASFGKDVYSESYKFLTRLLLGAFQGK